ncbi:MAG: PilZ domain-containing protein [Myxococcales bacterium]|nr:PilZ domain-containing protein [Myxococcales bacterium]
MYLDEPEPLEFRRSVRRFVRGECHVTRSRDLSPVGERLLDLSPDGALVASDAEVLPGETVRVSFRVPGTDAWFDADAHIARIVHGRRPGDPGRAVAVAFDRAPDEAREALARGLQRVPPTIPKPRRPAP